jgi:hypothetical protein
MQCRTETIRLRRGSQQLTINPEIIDGLTRYVGSVDGNPCITSITREGAMSGLLRRVISTAQREARIP